MPPPRHISEILRWSCSSRFQGVTTRPPPPSLSQILSKGPFDELNHVLANIREELKSVAIMRRVSDHIQVSANKPRLESHLPTIPGCEDKILPSWVLANEQSCVGSIGTPAHSAIEQLPIFEAREKGCDCPADRHLRRVRVGVCRMPCV